MNEKLENINNSIKLNSFIVVRTSNRQKEAKIYKIKKGRDKRK
jgi:hypothetical protein